MITIGIVGISIALPQICYESGVSTQRLDIPSVRKADGKTGRGVLLFKDANVGGGRHLVIDIACTHEFGGNHLRDVGHNGQMRDPDANKLLETTACTKVARYREAYAYRQGTTLPLATTLSVISCGGKSPVSTPSLMYDEACVATRRERDAALQTWSDPARLSPLYFFSLTETRLDRFSE